MFIRLPSLLVAVLIATLISGCGRQADSTPNLSEAARQEYFADQLEAYGKALAAVELPPLTSRAGDPDYFGFRLSYFPLGGERFASLTIERRGDRLAQHNVIATRGQDSVEINRDMAFALSESTLQRLTADLEEIDLWHLEPYTSYIGSGGRLIWVEAVSADQSILAMRWAPADDQMTLASLQKPVVLFSRILDEYGINAMWRDAARPSPED